MVFTVVIMVSGVLKIGVRDNLIENDECIANKALQEKE